MIPHFDPSDLGEWTENAGEPGVIVSESWRRGVFTARISVYEGQLPVHRI